MSSAPATCDAAGVSFESFSFPVAPGLRLDDSTLLDGAASVWLTLKFARRLPATPHTQRSLQRAEELFLDELLKCGFTTADIERRIAELRDRERPGGRGSPLGA